MIMRVFVFRVGVAEHERGPFLVPLLEVGGQSLLVPVGKTVLCVAGKMGSLV